MICVSRVAQKRLDANMYEESTEFGTDLQVVWANCYTYNGETSEVGNMAKELENLTSQRMKDMPMEMKSADGDQMKEMKKQVLLWADLPAIGNGVG